VEKLGIIREDVTPMENVSTEPKFLCDNKETGETELIKKAEESLEGKHLKNAD